MMPEPDYWAEVLAEEDEDAQLVEMTREMEGSMRMVALVVIAAFGGLILAGIVCMTLLWLILRWTT
jgi:hypothetical protein